MDTHIRTAEQCQVVECMCKDMVRLDPLWWPEMIAMHRFSLPYSLGNHLITRRLAVSTGAGRQDDQIGENEVLSTLAIAPRGGVNDRRVQLNQITEEAFNVF
jgi:hypothetical protein